MLLSKHERKSKLLAIYTYLSPCITLIQGESDDHIIESLSSCSFCFYIERSITVYFIHFPLACLNIGSLLFLLGGQTQTNKKVFTSNSIK